MKTSASCWNRQATPIGNPSYFVDHLKYLESEAKTIDAIIAEVAAARQTERGTRADDRRSETAMEERKRQGYF